jgi:hypothetical protein
MRRSPTFATLNRQFELPASEGNRVKHVRAPTSQTLMKTSWMNVFHACRQSLKYPDFSSNRQLNWDCLVLRDVGAVEWCVYMSAGGQSSPQNAPTCAAIHTLTSTKPAWSGRFLTSVGVSGRCCDFAAIDGLIKPYYISIPVIRARPTMNLSVCWHHRILGVCRWLGLCC